MLDIISNTSQNKRDLMGKTLAERVSMNFSKFPRVKIKKTAVKIPRLKGAKPGKASQKPKEVPVSSIISILIKRAVEKAKSGKKEKVLDGSKSYSILKSDEESAANGGYSSPPKSYGNVFHSSYVNYGKLFGYLGKFKSQSAYENMGEYLEALNKSAESGSFVLADGDSMDKIGRFDKYMRNPNTAIQSMALSLVPIDGLSSAEWEEVKRMMTFDPIMYTLKSKTS